MTFALNYVNLTMIEIHVLYPYVRQFGIAEPGEDEQLQEHHVRRVTRLPNGFVERQQFTICEQRGEPLFGLRRFHRQEHPRILKYLFEVEMVRPLDPQQPNQFPGHLHRRSPRHQAASKNEGRVRFSSN